MAKGKKQKKPSEKTERLHDRQPRHPLVRDLNHADKSILGQATRSFATYGAFGEPTYDSVKGMFSYAARNEDGSVWLSWGAFIQRLGKASEVMVEIALGIEREDLVVKLLHSWVTDEWRIKGLAQSNGQDRLARICGAIRPGDEVKLGEHDWVRIIDAMGREWRNASKKSDAPKSSSDRGKGRSLTA